MYVNDNIKNIIIYNKQYNFCLLSYISSMADLYGWPFSCLKINFQNIQKIS